MSISNSLAKDFAKIVNQKTNDKPIINLYGTLVTDGNKKFVLIDGSQKLTPILEATEAEAGDRVLVSIENHKAVVMGNFTHPASARKANQALTSAESAQTMALQAQNSANNAQSSADIAYNAANNAQNVADDTSKQLGELDVEKLLNGTKLQGIIDSLVTNQNAVQDLLKTINEEYLAGIDAKLGHIYIGYTNETEPTIQLGKEGSENCIIITNTKMIFQRGTNVGTYIDDDGLNVENITADEMRLGNWALVTHGEGNIGLIWRK